MKLIKFTLTVNEQIIREVNFHDGLNIITNRRNSGVSGNSIGKSTLPRIIDFLFLAPIDKIYIDEEYKKPNPQVAEFLTKNSVWAHLSFVDQKLEIHSIGRNIAVASSFIYLFDGIPVSELDYKNKVLKTCFSVESTRPSVRFIAPKFIRDSNHRMLNTLHFLDPKYTESKDYSELFLYLFGFNNTELLGEKRKYSNLITKRKKNLASLKYIISEQKLNKQPKQLEQQISELEKSIFQVSTPQFTQDFRNLLINLQADENIKNQELIKIEAQLASIRRVVDIIKKNSGRYLSRELEIIYDYAKISIEKPIEDYENVIAFHDNLVSQKIKFIEKDIPIIKEKQNAISQELQSIQEKRISILNQMQSPDAVFSITQNIKIFTDLKMELGKIEGILLQQKKAESDLSIAQDHHLTAIRTINDEISTVEKLNTEFNVHLAEITKLLYSEEYQFHIGYRSELGICEPKLINSTPNPEGGKKKLEVICFDLAYIKSVILLKLPRPVFVFHDSIEDIDHRQIVSMFNISNQMTGQHIVSMLSDKLPEASLEQYRDSIILELAEDDMFFKIPKFFN